MSKLILVLIRNYEPINICSWYRALGLVITHKATSLINDGRGEIHSAEATFIFDPVGNLVGASHAAFQAACQAHPTRDFSSRSLYMPVLWNTRIRIDGRPCHTTASNRSENLGKSDHCLQPVQSPQGRPHPRISRYATAPSAQDPPASCL